MGPATRVKFVYRKAIEGEILRFNGVADEVDNGAGRIVSAAKGYAPVRTGRYRSSIVARRDQGKSVAVATVPYAAYVEWGTKRPTPAAHPLGKAITTVDRLG